MYYGLSLLLEAISEARIGDLTLIQDLYEQSIFFPLGKDNLSNPEGRVKQAWTLEREQIQICILALAV